MNVIYYQRLVDRYETADRWLRVAAIILSSGGVVAAIKFLGNSWVVAVGAVSATLSAITLVWQLPERARLCATLIPQYVRHYHILEKLYFEGEDLNEKDLQKALADLERTTVLEAEKVRTVDEALRKKAYALVVKEIGG
jgi:hypothetical protein